jgi:hypothetical protein
MSARRFAFPFLAATPASPRPARGLARTLLTLKRHGVILSFVMAAMFIPFY